MRTLMLCGMALLMLCLSAFAEDTRLADVLSGQAAPLSITMKDLTADWRQMHVSTEHGGVEGQLIAMARAQSGGADFGLYYTKGQVLVIDGESFLVSYNAVLDLKKISAMVEQGTEMDKILVLTPDTSLTLTLLNLRTCGNFLDIRPFDPATAFVKPDKPNPTEDAEETPIPVPTPTTPEEATLANLHQLATTMMMYVHDNNGKYPPMGSVRQMQQALDSYLVSGAQFTSPKTGQPFLPNPRLSGISEAKVKYPAQTIVLYDAKPWSDGRRAIAFADGHAKLIPEAEWQRIKKQHGIP